ncbi:ATP-binding protein [Saccharopolyspora spinosa]|nr:ATP-binding protein [Saccharopolyspora spinosa]
MREEPQFLAALDLVALPTAVPVARMFIADTLRRWHALFIEDHMEAVAVELVSLSVQATSPAEDTSWTDITELNPITLRLLGYQRHIVFEVTDAHPEAFEITEDTELREDSGIGLVDGLANRWGSFVAPRGRVIWAELAVYERTKAGLPKRDRKPTPYPRGSISPPASAADVKLLRRVRDGLEKL